MRIIKEFTVQGIKCSIFLFQDKYSLKMEAGRMEQIIKFRDSALSSPDAIVKYLNELDKESLINSFKEMAQRRNDILKTEHSNPET